MDELLAELNRIHELADARNNYAKTLALVRALKGGSVTLENVTLTADGWTVQATAPAPPELRIEPETEGDL